MISETKVSILVVDDQPKWRNALQIVLEQVGYTVTTAADFETARIMLESRFFDLITLDVRLVDGQAFNVQGLGLLQMVKCRWPDTKVIIVTGYPESIRIGFLDEYEVDALFLKVPEGSHFDQTEFRQLVRKLLLDSNC
jgi:DNA-binding NtrC family response regulator